MTSSETTGISLRRLIASASLATAAAWLGTNRLMVVEIGLWGLTFMSLAQFTGLVYQGVLKSQFVPG
jgi:hypothetical protein